jgi:hypothetical protein
MWTHLYIVSCTRYHIFLWLFPFCGSVCILCTVFYYVLPGLRIPLTVRSFTCAYSFPKMALSRAYPVLIMRGRRPSLSLLTSRFPHGVRLSPLGTTATVRPIVPAPDGDDDGGMRIGRGN